MFYDSSVYNVKLEPVTFFKPVTFSRKAIKKMVGIEQNLIFIAQFIDQLFSFSTTTRQIVFDSKKVKCFKDDIVDKRTLIIHKVVAIAALIFIAVTIHPTAAIICTTSLLASLLIYKFQYLPSQFEEIKKEQQSKINELNIDDKNVFDICDYSIKTENTSLKERCFLYFNSKLNINDENVLDIFDYSVKTENMPLKVRCFLYFVIKLNGEGLDSLLSVAEMKNPTSFTTNFLRSFNHHFSPKHSDYFMGIEKGQKIRKPHKIYIENDECIFIASTLKDDFIKFFKELTHIIPNIITSLYILSYDREEINELEEIIWSSPLSVLVGPSTKKISINIEISSTLELVNFLKNHPQIIDISFEIKVRYESELSVLLEFLKENPPLESINLSIRDYEFGSLSRAKKKSKESLTEKTENYKKENEINEKFEETLKGNSYLKKHRFSYYL